MRVHVTNIYGIVSAGAKAQNAVMNIAKRDLQFEELGVYYYPVESDSAEMLRTRLDGIMASVWHEDVVIIQSPTGNDIKFDESFIWRLDSFVGLKKIVFIRNVQPLMDKEQRGKLERWINLYNQADLIIAPSQNMVDFLYKKGLKVEKIVVQKMQDYVACVDSTIKPSFRKVFNLIENPDVDFRFAFAKEWKYDNVQLAVSVNESDWAQGKNVGFLGWFDNDNLLVNALRKNGGFGLVWSEDPNWREYMRMDVSCKLSAYLAAGIPVVVPIGIVEQDTIIRKNLGVVVDSLDEAVERIEQMSEEEYRQMADGVERFAYLLRDGYFTKKVLTDAVFKLFDD